MKTNKLLLLQRLNILTFNVYIHDVIVYVDVHMFNSLFLGFMNNTCLLWSNNNQRIVLLTKQAIQS